MVPIAYRFAALAAVWLGGATLHADAIFLYNLDGSPRLTPFWDNVTILRKSGPELVFRTASGKEQGTEFAKIARITVAADPVLTDADDAYTLGKFDHAVEGYLKAIRTNDEWKIHWIAPRLSKAAARTSRFDAALTAYIGFAKFDPPAAVENKPALPSKGSRYLDEAIKQLEVALRTSPDDNQKQALLSLLLDVHMARGDSASAESTAEQLMAISGDQSDPCIAGMIAGIRLDQAQVQVSSGNFDRVRMLLDPVRASLLDPHQQARALFLLADAQRGLAGSDKTRQLDAAIAFMRVAAHFGTTDGRPFVGESLLEAAKLNASAGETASARRIYEQIESEFAGTLIAQQASTRREQLEP